MGTLQRDQEGKLRPIVRVTVNKDLYDSVCEEIGSRHINGLVDLLIQEWLNKRYKEAGRLPWKRPVRPEGY